MCGESKNASGYNKFVNITVHAIEKMYLTKYKGEYVTTLQESCLEDLSDAFIEYSNCVHHILYLVNDDTVEYQRLSNKERWIGRILNTQTELWEDVRDKELVSHIARLYFDKLSSKIVEASDRWSRYGFYMVRYYIPPCYRLVEYKDSRSMSKQLHNQEVDMRRRPRGEKYEHYSKTILVNLCYRLFESEASVGKWASERKVEDLFIPIMLRMKALGLLFYTVI